MSDKRKTPNATIIVDYRPST